MILTYQKRLIDEFSSKKLRNPKFSLRAFAKNLGVSPSILSTVLRGESHMTPINLSKVAANLGWPKADVERYVAELKTFQNKQRNTPMRKRVQPLAHEKYELLERYHLWCYHLARLPQNEATPAWIAEKMKISTKEAKGILENLVRHGFIRIENQKMVQTDEQIVFVEHPASETLINYKEQVQMLSRKAIRTVNEARQKSLVAHIAASEKDLEKIARYIYKLGLKSRMSSKQPEEIYYLSVHLFPCKGE